MDASSLGTLSLAYSRHSPEKEVPGGRITSSDLRLHTHTHTDRQTHAYYNYDMI